MRYHRIAKRYYHAEQVFVCCCVEIANQKLLGRQNSIGDYQIGTMALRCRGGHRSKADRYVPMKQEHGVNAASIALFRH